MSYQVGEFREWIKIQKAVLTPTAMGGNSVEYETTYEGFALVRPRTGGERRADNRLAEYHAYLVVVRNILELNETDQILWNGYVWQVKSINRKGFSSFYTEIDCIRGVAQ